MVIVFVGGGNITISMVKGLLRSGHPAKDIIISNPSSDDELAALVKLGVVYHNNNQAALAYVKTKDDIVVLAVKPPKAPEVAKELIGSLPAAVPVVSVVGGVSIKDCEVLFGRNCVQAMPNLAAKIGQASTPMYPSKAMPTEQFKHIQDVFAKMGEVIPRTYKQSEFINQDVSMYGCGTGILSLYMEVLQTTFTEQFGISAEQARQHTLDCFAAAVALAKQQETPSFKAIRTGVIKHKEVTTAIGFMEQDILDMIRDGLAAATARSQELRQQLASKSPQKPEVKGGAVQTPSLTLSSALVEHFSQQH